MIQLPLGLGQLDLQGWVLGLWAGAVQGGAGAVVAALAVSSGDPYYTFGNAQSFALMWKIFLVSGFLGGMSYLAKHPAPERVVTTTTETVEKKPKAVVTTTVAETHTEPAPKGGE